MLFASVASLALLPGCVLPALAGGTTPTDDALCEPGTVEIIVLDDAQRLHCRRLRQERAEQVRQRNQMLVNQATEETRRRRVEKASLPPAAVTVESFVGDGRLEPGDVVVTDKGPRVYVGQAGAPSGPGDFVAIDSPRSPHRARTTQFDGAFPERRPPTVKTPIRQDRQP